MFGKILIANRGEIALRILRTCHELGVQAVCAYSTADKDAKWVRLADEAVCIGPPPATDSYLNMAAIIAATEVTGAEAIHPGYGFLSENASFAEKVEASGFIFIGPRPASIRAMGDKVKAKEAMRGAGLKLIPGFDITPELLAGKGLAKQCAKVGFPLMVKSAAGGGGRGMKVIRNEAMLRNSVGMLAKETEAAFGDGTLYVEKLLPQARHVEVQVLADNHGNVVHLGTRDCSVQRRHQKLIEEAPAPGIPDKELSRLGDAAVSACRKLGYRGAGTMEFLYDGKRFYFIEMNTRIQVEHPVTELVTGIDIVEMQLRVADNETLPFRQKDIGFVGHALECRINAEDPETQLPSAGKVTAYHPAGGPGVRVDSHVYADSEISHHYDSLVCKLITHGRDREQAVARMRRACSEFVLRGISTNLALQERILANSDFRRGGIGIDFLENMP